MYNSWYVSLGRASVLLALMLNTVSFFFVGNLAAGDDFYILCHGTPSRFEDTPIRQPGSILPLVHVAGVYLAGIAISSPPAFIIRKMNTRWFREVYPSTDSSL